ncbi:hypothetical protein vBSsoS008_038 [Shigella phage vB_SsoS_008]|nr:hypothetical protein vBSsoS008_038 [Shigella phage vB_SsoS_008]
MFSRGGAITSVHFSNMLIYANALEYGHSQQAPSGVVGLVAFSATSYMSDAIKQARRQQNALFVISGGASRISVKVQRFSDMMENRNFTPPKDGGMC